jgi:hypothetical protein
VILGVRGGDYAHVLWIEVGQKGRALCVAERGRNIDLPIGKAFGGGGGDGAHFACLWHKAGEDVALLGGCQFAG